MRFPCTIIFGDVFNYIVLKYILHLGSNWWFVMFSMKLKQFFGLHMIMYDPLPFVLMLNVIIYDIGFFMTLQNEYFSYNWFSDYVPWWCTYSIDLAKRSSLHVYVKIISHDFDEHTNVELLLILIAYCYSECDDELSSTSTFICC